jgi:hypothetical protein
MGVKIMANLSKEEIHKILIGVFKFEMKRQEDMKKLKMELSKIKKNGIQNNPKRYAEILYEISIIDPVEHDDETK